jgi:type IV pilus assembly protein PilA
MLQSNLHNRGFTLIELMVAVAIVGILAAIAIPQYQTHVFRSQVQRVVGESGAIKPAVEVCLANGKTKTGDPSLSAENCDPQATGSNLQATAGNAAPTIATTWSMVGSGVPQVTLSSTVPSVIVATFGNLAGAPLQGATAGTITWSRDLNGSWSCKASNIDAKYVSAACPL